MSTWPVKEVMLNVNDKNSRYSGLNWLLANRPSVVVVRERRWDDFRQHELVYGIVVYNNSGNNRQNSHRICIDSARDEQEFGPKMDAVPVYVPNNDVSSPLHLQKQHNVWESFIGQLFD